MRRVSGLSLLPTTLLLISLVSGLPGQALIDQVGYPALSPKFAFFTQSVDRFSVVSIQSGEVVFDGEAVPLTGDDPGTGLAVWRGEFSQVQTPGIYRIQTSAGPASSTFVIADTVYHPLFAAALKAYFFQRCGMDLDPDHAGAYAHPACHTLDGVLHVSTGASGYRKGTGGWHDAGDYGKYVVNAGMTVGTLLMAYEMFPDRFADDHIGIPESGNGVPDLLDEVRIELQWLATMQDSTGGVHHKLTPALFEGFIMPQNDRSYRYFYALSTTATGDFAAVMSMAARTYRQFDVAFSDTCLTAARRAWAFLEAQPAILPAGGFVNPAGTETGTYGDTDDRDERLWASAELYRTTGEEKYHAYYVLNSYSRGLITGSPSWQNVTSMAHLSYLLCRRSDVDTLLQAHIRGSLAEVCHTMLQRRSGSGFHTILAPGEYTWGSNSSALNGAVLLLIGSRVERNSDFEDCALDQLHTMLGANGLGISFVTGFGAVSPRRPHHRPSSADGVDEPVPGLLVGGPNEYLNDEVLRQHFNESTPPALCYVDDEGSYSSNEVAINWNAPLVFVAGYFAAAGSVSRAGRPQGSLSPVMDMEPNYPNPFNAGTTLRWNIGRASDGDRRVRPWSLRVFDVVGRMVSVLVEYSVEPGEYSMRWNAGDLPSGIYIAALSNGTAVFSRKMLLAR